jgi:hypothetical protein
MGKFQVTGLVRAGFVVLTLLASAVPAAAVSADTRVTRGSPPTPFPQNKQNEPGIAVDPTNPSIVVAGSNDEIDLEACAAGAPNTCPFTTGVGLSGVYFSNNGGASFTQPTYDGWTARDCLGPAACTPHEGPIGTLPFYFENGLVSDGDPSLAFGPRRGTDGRFSWSNGSRLYYANLSENFSSVRSEAAFNGFEAIAVSRTDDVAAAAANVKSAWMPPVIVSRQNSALFSDHEQVWADNAASSASFGNVYICFAAFRSQEKGAALPEPIKLARSTDGGDTWSEVQLSAAANNNVVNGRQDCGVRTDSTGVVYVFWQGVDVVQGAKLNAIFLARSFDGGRTFEKPRAIAHFDNCGLFDPVGGTTFDGVAGARTGSFPSLDIANGAPTGAGATNRIVVTWCDGPTPSDTAPGPNEQALVMWSNNQGATFSGPKVASAASDRPDFPALAISPNGNDVYLVYTNFEQPYQSTTATPRLAQGVVRHADVTGGAVGAFSDLARGPSGDARGSSANALSSEFIGDYNNGVATNSAGIMVWNDLRGAADCPAVDAFRQALVNGTTATRPAPGSACPPLFGNTDIFGGPFADPTP